MIKKPKIVVSWKKLQKIRGANPQPVVEQFIDPDADEKSLEKLMPWNVKTPDDYPKPSIKIEENTS